MSENPAFITSSFKIHLFWLYLGVFKRQNYGPECFLNNFQNILHEIQNQKLKYASGIEFYIL